MPALFIASPVPFCRSRATRLLDYDLYGSFMLLSFLAFYPELLDVFGL